MCSILLLQHAEEVAVLWGQRDAAVRAPHYDFGDLLKHDDRLAAHLDGLLVAGEAGAGLARAQFEAFPIAGEAFAAGWLALEQGRRADFEALVDKAAAIEAADPPGPPPTENVGAHNPMRGLASALGWLEPARLAGLVADYLSSEEPARRFLGVAACAMHRRDPGPALLAAFSSDDARLCARAAKAAGELGRADAGPALTALADHGDPGVRFWAAWSAALLGDAAGAEALLRIAAGDGPFAARAAAAGPRLAEPSAARRALAALRGDPARRRRLIQMVGAFGDPAFAPWLLTQMADPAHARAAGEAFAMIAGYDLAYEDLDEEAPDGVREAPNDDPSDIETAADPDDDLPWPCAEKIEARLQSDADRLVAGERHVAGAPVAAAARALIGGFQRQRLAAALELARIGRPAGAALFPCAAPAPRQRSAAPMRAGAPDA